MARLSISYRRADSAHVTARIFDRLVAYYGKKSVFRDIDSIPPGIDFRTYIRDTLRRSDVLFAIIGPDWRGIKSDGYYRVEEENDLVRIEVETALEQGIPLIPVLVMNAEMPNAERLPESLTAFSYHNAIKIDSERNFGHDVDRLIRSTDSILREKRKGGQRASLMTIAAFCILLFSVGVTAYWWLFMQAPAGYPWMDVARDEIGEGEIPGPENNPRVLDYLAAVQSTRDLQDDEVDWASAFVEWSLNQVGLKGPQSMEPSDWLSWGREIAAPEQGCITVFSFKGLGHVGFFLSEEDKSLKILGGNQGDVVKVSRYAAKDALGFRLPLTSPEAPAQ